MRSRRLAEWTPLYSYAAVHRLWTCAESLSSSQMFYFSKRYYLYNFLKLFDAFLLFSSQCFFFQFSHVFCVWTHFYYNRIWKSGHLVRKSVKVFTCILITLDNLFSLRDIETQLLCSRNLNNCEKHLSSKSFRLTQYSLPLICKERCVCSLTSRTCANTNVF